MADEFMTIDEVADMLSVSREQVLRRRDLPRFKIGSRTVRIKRSDVESFLQRNRQVA